MSWVAGNSLSPQEWKAYGARLASESLKHAIPAADYYPPVDFPLILDRSHWQRLATIAEKLTAEVLRAERELVERIDLHQRLGLPASIREVFREGGRGGSKSEPNGAARYMRFDFHITSQGLRISEVNADTLGGFNVASLFTDLMAPYYPRYSRPPDPVRAHAMAARRAVGDGALVAIVRRTVHARDCEAKYLASGLSKQGLRGVIVSPGDLTWKSNRALLTEGNANETPDLLIRFLDAEWLPKLRPGSLWRRWFRRSLTAMSNPGTSILIQSKRLPLVWDDLKTPMPTWRAMIPETRCPSALQNIREGEWVLKPVFGRVGRGVAIRGVNTAGEYKEAGRQAQRHPFGWVAQRRFEMLPIETARGPRHICLGIFTVDGKAAGIYGRTAKRALIGQDAKDTVVLLRDR